MTQEKLCHSMLDRGPSPITIPRRQAEKQHHRERFLPFLPSRRPNLRTKDKDLKHKADHLGNLHGWSAELIFRELSTRQDYLRFRMTAMTWIMAGPKITSRIAGKMKRRVGNRTLVAAFWAIASAYCCRFNRRDSENFSSVRVMLDPYFSAVITTAARF